MSVSGNICTTPTNMKKCVAVHTCLAICSLTLLIIETIVFAAILPDTVCYFTISNCFSVLGYNALGRFRKGLYHKQLTS